MGILGGGCRGYPRKLAVCEVQGVGLVSPFLGQEVIISGLVIVDMEGIEPGGYLILDENCPQDGDSSRGLFISLGKGEDQVALGDKIQVRGIVHEIGGETRLEASSQGLEILSLSNPLPEPVNLGDSLLPPLSFSYEQWEGQLVAIPQVDLLAGVADSGRFQILPRITTTSAQLVCFQKDAFVLETAWHFLDEGIDSIQVASVMDDLVGVIRQDQDGYYLQLTNKPILRSEEKDPQIGEYLPVQTVSNQLDIPTVTNKPSSTSTMVPLLTLSPTVKSSPTMIPTPTYYPVKLLITEVLPNPAGDEPGGEWIEIYNPEGGKLPLNGIKIGDEVSPLGKEGLLRFPDGYFIQPAQLLVIANQASVFKNQYGFLPDFELVDTDPRVPDLVPYQPWGGSSVKLANSGDEVLLVDPWDQVVDLVVYGKSGVGIFSPPVAAPEEGHSLGRCPPENDRDQAGDWWEMTSPSPGRLNRLPPTMTATWTGSPVTTPSTWSPTPTIVTLTPEPMASTICPTGSSSPTGTPQRTSALFQTITPTDEPTPTEPPISTLTPVLIETSPPPPSLTTTSNPIPSLTLAPTLTVTSGSEPSQTAEKTISPTPSFTNNPTLEVSPSRTSTPTVITKTPSVTEQVTPFPTGTPTPLPTPTINTERVIIFNEILADPDPIEGDSNGDGVISSDDDEFLELVNIGGQALDLSGWSIFDAVRHRYTFPEGITLKPGCGLVVFGGGEPTGDFGGSLVFTAGSLGLNNMGDILTLLDPEGVEITVVRYGSEGNQDQSLTRFPDLIGQLVPHSLVPESAGSLFSPGKRVDQSSFGSCP